MASAAIIQALKAQFNHANVHHGHPGAVLPTGWPDIDAALGGGLQAGAVHEWLGLAALDDGAFRRRAWRPPGCIPVHLAWQALSAAAPPHWTAWIGRQCFPYPGILVRPWGTDQRLLERSLFVDAGSAGNRLWAIDLALRSPAIGFIVADGSAFSIAATRRMQLLAQEHQTTVCVVRPPWEEGVLSSAQSRWRVGGAPPVHVETSLTCRPRWRVDLLRCKGVSLALNQGPWFLEWDNHACALHLSSEVADPAGSTQTSASRPASGHAFRSA